MSLKGVVGVLPYCYAYVGEVFAGDLVAVQAVEDEERPYYDTIVEHREWYSALFEDKDTLVQNLAIKVYGLTALAPGWEAGVPCCKTLIPNPATAMWLLVVKWYRSGRIVVS